MNVKKYLFNRTLNIIKWASPILATKLLHYRSTGIWLDLDNPNDFNSKLQYLKLKESSELKSICADKYESHNYISSLGCSEILNEIYFVCDSPEEIEWDLLPEKVAIKCTHGCGYNIVTKKLSTLNKETISQKINKWLKQDFGNVNLEYHYSDIKPRIIAEKYIENSKGELPVDYKIYCFDGEPKLILVCSDRNNNLKLDFLDLNWKRLNIGLKEYESNTIPTKPVCFDEMIVYSKKLTKEFKFVRLDLYDNDGTPVFGEFTFTPVGNMSRYYNDYGYDYLNKLLNVK
ncbi:ATP-grasp fold amidoligase family protein [Vibrio breoganii]